MKNYRDSGAVGALLDEYEKACFELLQCIESISSKELVQIVDDKTKDPDCVSIQSVLSHVVRAGHNYVIAIRKHQREDLDFRTTVIHSDIKLYKQELKHMVECTEKLFSDYPDLPLEVHEESSKIHVTWGQKYDVEQLMEHAIVHVLRHRRQIERFKLKLHQKKNV